MTVNEDTTLSGDLDVSTLGKMIIARRITPPASNPLALGGAVTVEGALVVTGATTPGTVDQIMFSNASSAPTFTSRAPWNKLILYPYLPAFTRLCHWY